MTDFRCLVTGSREWGDEKTLFNALDLALAKHAAACKPGDWTFTIVHGANRRGADRLAAEWYAYRVKSWHENVREDPHPADWKRLGKSAGGARNQLMVDKGAGVCLAFYWAGANNAGTADCSQRAEAAGIPVERHYGGVFAC